MVIEDFKKREIKSRKEKSENEIGLVYKGILQFGFLRDFFLLAFLFSTLFFGFSPVTMGLTLKLFFIGNFEHELYTLSNIFATVFFFSILYVLLTTKVKTDVKKDLIKNISNEDRLSCLKFHLQYEDAFKKATEEYNLILENFEYCYNKERNLDKVKDGLNQEDLNIFLYLEKVINR